MSSNAVTVIVSIKRVRISENNKTVKGGTLSGAVTAIKSPSQLSWQQAVKTDDSKKNLSDVNIKHMSQNRRTYLRMMTEAMLT